MRAMRRAPTFQGVGSTAQLYEVRRSNVPSQDPQRDHLAAGGRIDRPGRIRPAEPVWLRRRAHRRRAERVADHRSALARRTQRGPQGPDAAGARPAVSRRAQWGHLGPDVAGAGSQRPAGRQHGDDLELKLPPSAYFKRQMYGCFWFETGTIESTIEQLGPDRILYESDFPHPTSMSPGPATAAVQPRQYIAESLGHLPEKTLQKILHATSKFLPRGINHPRRNLFGSNLW